MISGASEVVLGAIEKGLGFIQTCGQKGIETSIGVAAGIFDFFSGIISKIEDSVDLAIESLIEEEALEELFYFYCEFSEIWDSFLSIGAWKSIPHWDSLIATCVLSFSIFGAYAPF